MIDAPMSREEAELLLELCEAADAPEPEGVGAEFLAWQDILVEWQETARTALPRALREVLRLHARNVELEAALQFYANPESYLAVAVLGDPPCGEFADDIGETGTDMGARHGKRAREVLDKEECSLLGQLCAELERDADEIARLRRALDAAGIVLGK